MPTDREFWNWLIDDWFWLWTSIWLVPTVIGFAWILYDDHRHSVGQDRLESATSPTPQKEQ